VHQPTDTAAERHCHSLKIRTAKLAQAGVNRFGKYLSLPLPINGTQGFTGATRAFTGELPNPRKPPDNLISWSLDKGREKNLLFCTWVVPRRSFNS
jgi:hypothetical protein